MIKIDSENKIIELKGNIARLLTDFCTFAEILHKECDIPKEALETNLKMAFMNKEELKEETLKSLKELFEKLKKEGIGND